MGVEFQCNFNLEDCMEKLGINERGRVQQYVTNEVKKLSEPYIPFDVAGKYESPGSLKDSGHIENGTDVVWNTPYARYQWGGIVYEYPSSHCAGFQVEDGGYRSRKGTKVPTNRLLKYQGAPTRGAKWVPRMLQEGGLKEIEDGARKEAAKG